MYRGQQIVHYVLELALTLEQMPAIEAFEARRRVEMPWLG